MGGMVMAGLAVCGGASSGQKPEEREGGGAPLKKDGFRVRFFLYFFSDVVKIAPPQVLS